LDSRIYKGPPTLQAIQRHSLHNSPVEIRGTYFQQWKDVGAGGILAES